MKIVKFYNNIEVKDKINLQKLHIQKNNFLNSENLLDTKSNKLTISSRHKKENIFL